MGVGVIALVLHCLVVGWLWSGLLGWFGVFVCWSAASAGVEILIGFAMALLVHVWQGQVINRS
jgi:hypothetical protein